MQVSALQKELKLIPRYQIIRIILSFYFKDINEPVNEISNTLGMCDQQSLRSACAYAFYFKDINEPVNESDQSLCLSCRLTIL